MITVRPTTTLPADHLVVTTPAGNALATPWSGSLVRPPAAAAPVRFADLPVAQADVATAGPMSLQTPWQFSVLGRPATGAASAGLFRIGLVAPVAPAMLPAPRLSD